MAAAIGATTHQVRTGRDESHPGQRHDGDRHITYQRAEDDRDDRQDVRRHRRPCRSDPSDERDEAGEAEPVPKQPRAAAASRLDHAKSEPGRLANPMGAMRRRATSSAR